MAWALLFILMSTSGSDEEVPVEHVRRVGGSSSQSNHLAVSGVVASAAPVGAGILDR